MASTVAAVSDADSSEKKKFLDKLKDITLETSAEKKAKTRSIEDNVALGSYERLMSAMGG